MCEGLEGGLLSLQVRCILMLLLLSFCRWLDHKEGNTVRSVSVPPYIPWPTRHSQPDRIVPYGDVLDNHTPYQTKLGPTSSRPQGWTEADEAPRPQPKQGEEGYPSLVHDIFGNAKDADQKVEVSMYTEYHPDLNRKYKKAMKTFGSFGSRVDDRANKAQQDVRWGVPRHY